MKRKTPLKSGGPIARRTKLKAKRTAPRRVAVLRDRQFLDWLITERCVACLNPEPDQECDPAHGPSNGTGSKGPDNGAIPLCRHHHAEQHQIGWPLFEAKYGFSREKEAAAHYAAYIGFGAPCAVARNLLP